MITLGQYQSLRVVKQVDFGFYLDGLNLGEILLPIKYAREHLDIDDIVDVFLYLDSEDRPVATTETPLVTVGGFAHLKTVSVSKFGAFVNWGLEKDLLVPHKEQRVPMQVDRSYTVYVYIDVTGRIAATTRLSDHFAETAEEGEFDLHQEVDLHISTRSDLGYRAIINGTHLGLIHVNDIYKAPKLGEKTKGYIKSIREDGRINLSLQSKAPEMRMVLRGELTEQILQHLKNHEGHSPLTDKSPPEDIYAVYNVSKANYKKALGKLYKEKKILITSGRISLA